MAAYGTDDGLQQWLDGLGLVLPDGSPSLAVLRQIGSSYVDSAYSWKLVCSQKTGGFEQILEWPRTGQYSGGQLIPSDLIPQAWVYASYRAGYLTALQPGWATTGTDPTRQTRREKADSVEREFFAASESAGSSSAPGFPSDSIINGMVLPFLCAETRSLGSLFRVI